MKAVIGLLVCGVGLLTNIVGIALPFWRYYGVGESSAYFGLWVNCVNLKILTASIQECAGFSNEVIDDKLRAVRALEIIGMIGMAVAVVCVLLKMTRMRENDRLPKVTGVVAIVSGILMIIGCIIFYTWDAFSTKYVLHIGFALCIVAGIISISSGVCNFLIKRSDSPMTQNLV